MRKPQKKSKIPFYITVMILCVITAVIARSALSESMAGFLAPFTTSIMDVLRSINDKLVFYSSLDDIYEENKILRQKTTEIVPLTLKLEEVIRENRRLKEQLDFAETPEAGRLLCSIISYDLSDWYASVFIDKGSEHGVKIRQPVVTPDGVIGCIDDVRKTSSRVRLITDSGFKAGVMIRKTGDACILNGRGSDTCGLDYIDLRSSVTAGDAVVTARYSTLFPPHLMVGRVTQVVSEESSFYKTARLKPSASVYKSLYVSVLLWDGSS